MTLLWRGKIALVTFEEFFCRQAAFMVLYLHWLHLKGLGWKCVFLWRFRWHSYENEYLHLLHLNGFSPPCFSLWVFLWLPRELVGQRLRSTHHMSAGNGWKWEWPNGVEKSEMDLFWSISLTNNVKSCKKINGRVQTFRLNVFTMGGHWLTGAPC